LYIFLNIVIQSLNKCRIWSFSVVMTSFCSF